MRKSILRLLVKIMQFSTETVQYAASESLLKKTVAVLSGSILLACLLGVILPWPITVLHAIWLQGVIAALMSFYLFHLPVWQAVIHLLFFPALLSAIAILDLPVYWYLAGFIILILIFGRIYHTRVPLFMSSHQAIDALAELLPKDRNFKLIDLGSGCGGLICKLARISPHGSYHGVEAAILSCWISKLRVRLSGQDCHFKWGSIWQHDLAEYDVVYAYLSPVPMSRLWEKARREMCPGSLFISNTFVVPDIQPDRCIRLDDFSGAVLYVWQIPKCNIASLASPGCSV